MKKHPHFILAIAVVTSVVAITVIALYALEMATRFFFPVERKEILGEYSQKFNLPDLDFGYKPRSNARVSAIRRDRDGHLIYSVHYSTDELSRRVTPMIDQGNRPDFMLFFGCSFTFGEGLEDNQTLPYYVSRYAPCYTPYNYGYSGYGPQQMLVRLMKPDFVREVSQGKGILLYGPAHVARAIGSYRVSTGWARDFPFFYLDGRGNLLLDGNFQTGRPVRSGIYAFLSEIRLFDVFLRRFDVPHKFSDQDIKLTSGIIEKSFKLFYQYYPDSTAYFMLLPGVDESDHAVATHLKRAGIPVLDFSSHEEFNNREYVIANDGHPTDKWNERLAQLIVEKLGISSDECNRP